jgi:hypothetical protein
MSTATDVKADALVVSHSTIRRWMETADEATSTLTELRAELEDFIEDMTNEQKSSSQGKEIVNLFNAVNEAENALLL